MIFDGRPTTLQEGDVLVYFEDPSLPEHGHIKVFRYGLNAHDAGVYWQEHRARSWTPVHEADFGLGCKTLASALNLDLERLDDPVKQAFRLVKAR